MLKLKSFRLLAFMVVFAVLGLGSGAVFMSTQANGRRPRPIASAAPSTGEFKALLNRAEAIDAEPDSLAGTSTYYTVRADLRRCMSPMCGGFFIKRVNMPLTRCANGRFSPECYVAEIDWPGAVEVDSAFAVLRGEVSARRYGQGGIFGVLRVTEAWRAVSNAQPAGGFYRVRDRGLRCIAFPCPTHHEARLNSTSSQNIAGVDLKGFSSADVSQAITGPGGVIVAGEHLQVKGPGGRLLQLKATQVYLRVGKEAAQMKPCIKTGCSSQVCSDHAVVTTCEWREQYACYQKATCERQSDGNCGFTPTRELTACLAAR